MGIFDLFKKKGKSRSQNEVEQIAPVNQNEFLLRSLFRRIAEMGYSTQFHQEYQALIVNNDLEIAAMIMEIPGAHPSLMQFAFVTTHAVYIPDGIEEFLAGFGQTLEDKINAGITNYLNTIFSTLIESMTDTHDEELDFFTNNDGSRVLWHPNPGNISLQGSWSEMPVGEPIFDLLREDLKMKLTNEKFQWLKAYASRQPDGTIIGECNLNNEPWPEGMEIINSYVKTWKNTDQFLGLKQFIVFRKCDAYDDINSLG